MKKKFLLFLAMFTLVSLTSFSQTTDDPNGDPLIFTIINPGSGGNTPKQPIVAPVVYFDGTVLYFCDNATDDMVLHLVDPSTEQEVVTAVIYAGTPTYILPSTLAGEYELILERGSYAFITTIEVSE